VGVAKWIVSGAKPNSGTTAYQIQRRAPEITSTSNQNDPNERSHRPPIYGEITQAPFWLVKQFFLTYCSYVLAPEFAILRPRCL
jgi:hypothetical protein